MNLREPHAIVLRLCPHCGLCCNSVLFADVELQSGDKAGRLTKLGMTLLKKETKRAFAQPCSCFDGTFCCIYADRPKRCRTFECGLLKRVKGGGMETMTALGKIYETQHLAERVRRLLRQLGQKDENLALTNRYQQAMNAPIDLSRGEAAAELRGELMLAVNDLMEALQRYFLKTA